MYKSKNPNILFTKSAQIMHKLYSNVEMTGKDQMRKIENLPDTLNYLVWYYSCLPKFNLLKTKNLVYIYYFKT